MENLNMLVLAPGGAPGNKITVIVDRAATKKQIADEIRRLYGVEVEKVNTLITPEGEKKAYVKLTKEHNAMDLLSRLGVL